MAKKNAKKKLVKHTLLRRDGTTTCCDAYTSISIDDGVQYCKACYHAIAGLAPERAKTIDDDDFQCACGNVSSSSGFDSCSKNGKRREPTRGWSGHYICNDCGALYQLTQNAAK